MKTIPIIPTEKTSGEELLDSGNYILADFASRIDDTRTIYFTLFILKDDTKTRAYGYAVTCENILGTLILNRHYYWIESPLAGQLTLEMTKIK